jgi:hypothetical protein
MREKKRQPIDAERIHRLRLAERLQSVESFATSIRHSMENEDWCQSNLSAQALLLAAGAVVENVAVIDAIETMKSGTYAMPGLYPKGKRS